MPAEGVVFATCISAAAATLVMGLYANYPIALAPGMSLNAYFTYSVCIAMHVPWRTALAVVFCSGVLFLVLTVTRVRAQIVNGMPDCLKHSTAAGNLKLPRRLLLSAAHPPSPAAPSAGHLSSLRKS